MVVARPSQDEGSRPEAALLDALPDAVLAIDGDGFGVAVAIHDDVLVVGAPATEVPGDTPLSEAGAAYVYRYDTDAEEWFVEATLTARVRQAGAQF